PRIATLSLSLHGSAAHRDLPSFPTRRSSDLARRTGRRERARSPAAPAARSPPSLARARRTRPRPGSASEFDALWRGLEANEQRADRKSTRLNSSHRTSSYAVFCLKKKNKKKI